MSQLKLSSIKTTQNSAADLEKAQGQLDELTRLLSAERQASKSLALKLGEARAHSDDRLASENEELYREIEKLNTAQQILRLEGVVGQDVKARKLAEQLKERSIELSDAKKLLKEFQVFDPERQKRQLADQKKRIAEQTTLSKDLNTKLKVTKREVSELKRELTELKKGLESDLPVSDSEPAAATEA
ncbi:MAG: leucyl aminopeptidase [Motiliproteus sp.]|jgi:leucyl aminopeptidase